MSEDKYNCLSDIERIKRSTEDAALDFIYHLYFHDSHGDFCGAEASDRSAFVGDYYDMSSLFRNNFVFDFWKYSCNQTYFLDSK